MGYYEDHQKSGFKVGDTVRVIREAYHGEGGWVGDWIEEMGNIIGKEHKITTDKGSRCYGFSIEYKGNLWHLPWFILEKASCSDDKLKEGDEVEIIANESELGSIGTTIEHVKRAYPKMKGVITGCYYDIDKFFLRDEVGVPVWFRASHLRKIEGTPSPKGIISSLDDPISSPKVRGCSTCKDNSSSAMEGGCGDCYGDYSNYIKG